MKVYGNESERSQTESAKVGVADYAVSADGEQLSTTGLGSCVGVALYDEDAGVAGLAHVMLPSSAEVGGDNEAKFADTAIPALVAEMEAAGATRDAVEAKIAGGSTMLDFRHSDNVGDRNVEAVREALADLDLSVVDEDVGGSHGRSLVFDPSTFELRVKSANVGNTVI